MDQPEKRLGGIQLQKFSKLPECQIQRGNYCFYICVWHYRNSQAGHTESSFCVPEVHYICTWHSGCLICDLRLRSALLQFNFHSVFTSSKKTLKIHIVSTGAQEKLKPPSVYQFNQILCVQGPKPAHISGDTVPLIFLNVNDHHFTGSARAALWAYCLSGKKV